MKSCSILQQQLLDKTRKPNVQVIFKPWPWNTINSFEQNLRLLIIQEYILTLVLRRNPKAPFGNRPPSPRLQAHWKINDKLNRLICQCVPGLLVSWHRKTPARPYDLLGKRHPAGLRVFSDFRPRIPVKIHEIILCPGVLVCIKVLFLVQGAIKSRLRISHFA